MNKITKLLITTLLVVGANVVNAGILNGLINSQIDAVKTQDIIDTLHQANKQIVAQGDIPMSDASIAAFVKVVPQLKVMAKKAVTKGHGDELIKAFKAQDVKDLVNILKDSK